MQNVPGLSVPEFRFIGTKFPTDGFIPPSLKNREGLYGGGVCGHQTDVSDNIIGVRQMR